MKNKMNKDIVIKQHYIQKFSLAQFGKNAKNSNRYYLKCFDNESNNYIEEVKNICCEPYFYEYEKFDKNYFEHRISILELTANNAFLKILKEYNRTSPKKKKSIYSLKTFNCCMKEIKLLHIYKFIMLQFVRTKKYRDLINDDDLFFKILNDILSLNIQKVKNSCFYKNYNVYMCINNTNMDLLINDVNIYYLKDNSGNDIITYHLNKNTFFVFINKNKKLNLKVNEELILKINENVKKSKHNLYFKSPTQQEIENYRLKKKNGN